MTVRMGLVLDCANPEALAAFWAPALGYTNVGSAGSYVMLLPAEGDGPQLLLQRVVRSEGREEPDASRHPRRRHRAPKPTVSSRSVRV